MQPERRSLVHSTSILIILLMAGLLAVFLALGAAYAYARLETGVDGVSTPGLFFANTLILLAASFSIHRWQEAYRTRKLTDSLRWGWLTLLLSLLFLTGQALAWWWLFRNDRLPGTTPGTGYLYALSILHLLHVVAGLPFLVRVLVPFVRAVGRYGQPALFQDPIMERRLHHTAWYWHFLDAVWLGIMFVLVVSSLF